LKTVHKTNELEKGEFTKKNGGCFEKDKEKQLHVTYRPKEKKSQNSLFCSVKIKKRREWERKCVKKKRGKSKKIHFLQNQFTKKRGGVADFVRADRREKRWRDRV